METTPIQTYVWPTDGHDYCHSCNYLEQVHTTMLIDFEDVMVPLCFECAVKIGASE
jgi:hypothetical protein